MPAESAPARRAQNLLLEREVNVLGGYVDKTLDLALWSETSGPLLALSVKSQMSSISANARNRFEEYFADAANLHTRFPMLAFGFLLILPYETASGEQVIDQSGQPTPLAWRVLRLLQGVSGRIDPESQVGHYEETALLLVDFNATPVQIHPSFPDSQSGLRIENFFDRLVSRFWQRNPTLRRDSK
ncbi:MAG: hypothetical protein RML84_00500 [Anaerolineae bacterium]|nr:hypothetical protein [Anaerolineae bacterium]